MLETTNGQQRRCRRALLSVYVSWQSRLLRLQLGTPAQPRPPMHLSCKSPQLFEAYLQSW